MNMRIFRLLAFGDAALTFCFIAGVWCIHCYKIDHAWDLYVLVPLISLLFHLPGMAFLLTAGILILLSGLKPEQWRIFLKAGAVLQIFYGMGYLLLYLAVHPDWWAMGAQMLLLLLGAAGLWLHHQSKSGGIGRG